MKPLAFIRAIVLLTMLAGVTQTHAGQIGISFRDTTIQGLSELNYAIQVDSSVTGLGVTSYQFEITYNTSLFSFDSASSAGTMDSSWGVPECNESPLGYVHVALAGSDTLQGIGALVYLHFTAKNPSYSYSGAFHFQSALLNEGTPEAATHDGNVTVLPLSVVTISPNTLLLAKGEHHRFTVSSGIAPFTWSSTVPSVATIDSTGVLTALQPGFTRVVCRDSAGVTDTTDAIEVRALKLWLRDTSIYQGELVNLPIYVSSVNGLGIVSGEITMTYDQYLWTPAQLVTAGTLLQSASLAAFNIVSPGSVKISFSGTTALSNSGVLFYLQMKATAATYGGSTLDFSYINFNQSIPAAKDAGYLTVLQLSTVSISPSGTQLLIAGDSLKFQALGGTPPYVWSVSDSRLASVSSVGWMKALKSGTVTVTATDSLGATGNSGNIHIYDMALTIPDTSFLPASLIEVPVYVSRADTSFFSYQMTLTYGTSYYLRFVGISTSGTISSGWSVEVSPPPYSDGNVNIDAASGAGSFGGGVLFKLQFAVADTTPVPSTTSVSMSNVVFNEGKPAVLFYNGSVKIADRSAFGIMPAQLQFHTATASASDSNIVTITNAGTAALTYSFFFAGKGASKFSAAPSSDSVSAHDSVKIKIYYKPTAIGVDTAYALVNTNDPYSSQATVTLIGKAGVTAVQLPSGSQAPVSYSLAQNYPNPFNPTTQIRFEIPISGFVTLKVFDVLGREVATLVNEQQSPGTHEVSFDAGNFSSGIYFYTIRVGEYSAVRKMLLLK
ncbi:MAG: T9SS type A sorting domain-containing protein [Bacteroidota bacterium]|nr:T9SS type A sorting domain-containing protein [Bacteroidota bacterium]